jgi:hypothetical protein
MSTNEDSINSDDNKTKSEEEVSGGIFLLFISQISWWESNVFQNRNILA